jgi:hypothetical protein
MCSTYESGDKLAAINNATIGTEMPVVTLPDGSKIQTGTVATLLINIRSYDEVVGQELVDEQKRKT